MYIYICIYIYIYICIYIYVYIYTRGSWENSKLYENTPPFGRRVSIQFLVFPIPLVLI